jgi:hypothetical protein
VTVADAVQHESVVRLSSLWRMAVGLMLGFGSAIAVIATIDVLSVNDTDRQESVVVQRDDLRQYCERRGLQLAEGGTAALGWSCVDPGLRSRNSIEIVLAELCREQFGTVASNVAAADGAPRCAAGP